uniref:Uncharacterized protein n=1 Tax=Chrysotila carterae TaxID=13221 RepID=A0A7S4BVQ4_CHRCT
MQLRTDLRQMPIDAVARRAAASQPECEGVLPAWGYQSCTETLHRFSVPPGAWRSYEWDERRLSDACFAAFGVRPRLDWIEGWSGGYAIADLRTTTNLIWSNGKLDPWHRGGFLRQTDALPGGRVFVFDYTAHHQDLRAPSADDPSELVVARAVEEELIRRWIQEAASATASSF